jgi:hypothetical protein
MNKNTSPASFLSRKCSICGQTFTSQKQQSEQTEYTTRAGVRTHGPIISVPAVPAYIIRQMHERDDH